MNLRPHQERIIETMKRQDKGQILVPTGGGKTLCMIKDAESQFNSCNWDLINKQCDRKTIVIVAPRILLAQQLCDDFIQQLDDNINIFHIHSGRTSYDSSTKPHEIEEWVSNNEGSKLLFTTYHSLKQIIESGINIDNIYFDEAHNSTCKSFFISVAAASQIASRCYYFTATPRVSYKHHRGMNNSGVYGNIIENVPAPELINNGSILPPTIVPFEVNTHFNKVNAYVHHALTVENYIDSITTTETPKVLISVPSSRILNNMLGHTSLLKELETRGYEVLHITSKFGAYVNKTKVNRTTFFETLKQWGEDDNKKFVIFHYSILSEGINVSGLTHTLFLRNLNVIEMAQSIGRVIRLNKQDSINIKEGNIPAGNVSLYRKSTGYCVIPIHKSYGTKCYKRIERIVNDIFIDGTHTHAVC